MNEDKATCQGWSTSTLYSHFTALLATYELRLTEAQSNNERELNTFVIAFDKRMDSMNEFRSSLSDQARTFIPRAESEIMFNTLSSRMVILEKQFNEQRGRNYGLGLGWSILLALFGVAGTLFGILKH